MVLAVGPSQVVGVRRSSQDSELDQVWNPSVIPCSPCSADTRWLSTYPGHVTLPSENRVLPFSYVAIREVDSMIIPGSDGIAWCWSHRT